MEEFKNMDFSVMGTSGFVKIFEKMEPEQVIAFCQTNKPSARVVCSDQKVFVQLMKIHYPQFPINQDAKAQYMAIAKGEAVEYWFEDRVLVRDIPQAHLTAEEKMPKEEFSKSGLQRIYIPFEISGTRIKVKIIWFLKSWKGSFMGKPLPNLIFMTREDAIDEVMSGSKGYAREEVEKILETSTFSIIKKYPEEKDEETKIAYELFQVQLPD